MTKTKSAPAAKAAAKPAVKPAAKPVKVDIVTLRQLAAAVAEAHHLSQKQANEVLSDTVAAIGKHLKKGARIRIAGLGTLEVRKRAARMAASIMAAPVQRSAMEASFQRLTLRHTRRIVPFMFSMMLVHASERRSSAGKPRRVTVRISSSPSRMLPETPGDRAPGGGQGCGGASQLLWRHPTPTPAAVGLAA
jgi:DNA-binding protein HU-beta